MHETTSKGSLRCHKIFVCRGAHCVVLCQTPWKSQQNCVNLIFRQQIMIIITDEDKISFSENQIDCC